MRVIYTEEFFRVSALGKDGLFYEVRDAREGEWRRADNAERNEFFKAFAEVELRSIARDAGRESA